MNVEQASRVILGTHTTEKTFPMVENEGKICFIVERNATKNEIAEAVRALYEQDAIRINTARTVRGKKAFVKFKDTDVARDLATKMGML